MAKYPSVDDLARPPRPRGVMHRVWRHVPGLAVLVMSALLVTVVLWPYVVITIPSGRVGVLWKRFNGIDIYCWCWVGRGTVLDPRELREEGLHLVWPWDNCSSTICACNPRRRPTTPFPRTVSACARRSA